MENYFEFYGLPISFFIDEGELKRAFLQKTRQFHPDRFTLASEEEQMNALEMTSLNNAAYKTLKDFDLRVKYILDESGALGAEGQNKLPQMFLMEMMDLNDEIMEAKMEGQSESVSSLEAKIDAFEQELYDEVEALMKNYSSGDELNAIKDFYLKRRYLRRLRQNLANETPEM